MFLVQTVRLRTAFADSLHIQHHRSIREPDLRLWSAAVAQRGGGLKKRDQPASPNEEAALFLGVCAQPEPQGLDQQDL